MNRRRFVVTALSVPIAATANGEDAPAWVGDSLVMDKPIAFTASEGGQWVPADIWNKMSEKSRRDLADNVRLSYEGETYDEFPRWLNVNQPCPAAELYGDGRIYDHVIAENHSEVSPWRMSPLWKNG